MSVPWDKVDEEYVETKNGNQNQLVMIYALVWPTSSILILLPIYVFHCVSGYPRWLIL